MSDSPLLSLNRPTVLASGARCPFLAVSGALGLLESLLAEADTRPLVGDLRRLCLGEDVPAERLEPLRREGLIGTDGAVKAPLKEVVLAALRGEGEGLHVVSPFTTAWDRTLHQFLDARDGIRSTLPPAEADRLIREDLLAEFFLRRTEQPANQDAGAAERAGPRRWTEWLTQRDFPGPTDPQP